MFYETVKNSDFLPYISAYLGKNKPYRALVIVIFYHFLLRGGLWPIMDIAKSSSKHPDRRLVVHFGKRLWHFDKLNNRLSKCHNRAQHEPQHFEIHYVGVRSAHRQPTVRAAKPCARLKPDPFAWIANVFRLFDHHAATLPCLDPNQGGSFALLATTPEQYLYFRFDESGLYTRRLDETEAVITNSGMDFLRRVYQANQGKFLFADILLRHRESATDFAQSVVKQLAAKKIATIHAQENMIIRLRQAYFIEVCKAG